MGMEFWSRERFVMMETLSTVMDVLLTVRWKMGMSAQVSLLLVNFSAPMGFLTLGKYVMMVIL